MERLAVSTIVESEDGPRVATRLTRRGEGILANYTDVEQLLVPQVFAPGPKAAGIIAAPPLLFLITTLVRRQRERLRHDPAYASRRSAKSTALRALRQAADAGEPRSEAALVLGALTRYVANRCGLPDTVLTRAEAVQRLRDRGVAEEKVRTTDAVLESCEGLQYAGVAGEGAGSLTARARRCIAELEKERFA
jgi:hypothetical protein